jgi:hypothetical protein
LWAGRALEPRVFADIRRRLLLDGCKWDPQVGDVSTIAPHPLLLDGRGFAELYRLAAALARETLAIEEELAQRPDCHVVLGLPGVLRRLWRRQPPSPPARGRRLLRFDFHLTPDGWRVSEVNSDVAGGFAEASFLPSLLVPHYPGTRTAGDPAGAWTERIADHAGGDTVALISAPGFMEDQQVVAFLSRLLDQRRCPAVVVRVEDVVWKDGTAVVRRGDDVCEAGAVVRFLQAEWLLPWPRPRGWAHYFQATRTPVFNDGTAILTESKRLPLVWDRLGAPTATWRALLPESREPAEAPLGDDDWLLKGAFSNNGEAVVGPWDGDRWHAARREAWRHPMRWVAQRRFEPSVVETSLGARVPCLGVYTLGETPVGIYGRLSAAPTVDHRAADVAVLVDEASP